MAKHDELKVRFGKYKGERLADIDVRYLDWLIGCDWLRDPLKKTITEHLRGRAEWAALGDDEAPEKKDDDEGLLCPFCCRELTASLWCAACEKYPYEKKK